MNCQPTFAEVVTGEIGVDLRESPKNKLPNPFTVTMPTFSHFNDPLAQGRFTNFTAGGRITGLNLFNDLFLGHKIYIHLYDSDCVHS